MSKKKDKTKAEEKLREMYPNPPDLELNVASSTECTGLIPSETDEEAELEEYEEIIPFISDKGVF